MGVSEKFRIVHVLECFSAGSMEVLRILANSQISEGYFVTILHGGAGLSSRSVTENFHKGIKFRQIGSWRKRRVFSVIGAAIQIRNEITRRSPDIIHLHSSLAGAAGRIAVVGLDIPIVYTPHGISFLRKDVSSLVINTFVNFERGLNFLRPSTYVACSKSEEVLIRSKIANILLVQIDNGICSSYRLARKHEQPWHSGVKGFVAIGRISPQKSYSDLVALKKATGVKITLVGDGPPDQRRYLENNGIFVTGWVNHSDIPSYLLDNQVLIQSSLWEGMPMAVIEAMSLGVPIIARACAGNIDLVENGVNGFLYSDVSELIECVEGIKFDGFDGFDMSSMSLQAYKTYASRHTDLLMASRYLELYKSLLVDSSHGL